MAIQDRNRTPLPAGAVINFCDELATVVRDTGGEKLDVLADGYVQPWYWTFEGESCAVVSLPGAPADGFRDRL